MPTTRSSHVFRFPSPRGPRLAAILSAAALTAAAPLAGQSTAAFVPEPAQGQAFELSIRSIMRGPENVGEPPAAVRWTDDGQQIYFRWRPAGEVWDAGRSLYRVAADGSGLERIPEAEEPAVAPLIAQGDISPDRRWRVSAVDGDLYLVDRQSMSVRRLTRTEESERTPLFGTRGRSVIFRRGNDLYRMALGDGTLEQLTRIEEGPAPKEAPEAKGQRKFLQDQQRELFEHVRRTEARKEHLDSLRKAREAEEPSPLYLKRGERVQALRPTRDGRYVLVSTFIPATGAKRTAIPEWITEDGYTQTINGRTKVGDVQGSSRLGLLATATGEVTWISTVPENDTTPQPARVFNAGWNDAGTTAFVFSVSVDNKDRWIWAVEASTGERQLLDHLHDDAWVAGPCFTCAGFIPGSDRVWYVSEKSGYAHLYAVNADGSEKKALTRGAWEILGVAIPEDRTRFLLTTNEGSPFNQHLWWMGFDGSGREPITRGEGRYSGVLSPDGKHLALVHDVANRPPELFVAAVDAPEAMTQVTHSPSKAWLSFPWRKPEIVRFEAEDGTKVPARIYRPAEMGAEANGAGIIFVHGAGYLHNVHNYWSSYYREYQFNHFLAAAGYTVLDMDYRGSAGYGRDWRTAIYRWMGGKDLSDQVDGARYLVRTEGVDPRRVGLYGGSYGGFITLMGLFTAPETFRSGAALRSVTDWAHYNNGYTSRILNLPQDDEEAYKRSSPIYFAENFRPDQHLLILHGMVDTNVHFSDVVRLAQRLIELEKENWEFAVYPVENHGFVEPASWTDEYRRIFELFERTLSAPGCTDNGDLCPVRQGGE